MQRALVVISYSTAALLTLFGASILLGIVPVFFPELYRILFGVVLLLYGIFRIVTIYTKQMGRNKETDFPV